MQETPPVPANERATENRRVDETETVADDDRSATAEVTETSDDETTDTELIDRRFSRHRAGDTVVLYDRLEQTTWVQADIDPSELV